MRSSKTILYFLCANLFAFLSFGQNQEVQVTTTKVSDHIYMLKGRGGNIAISVGEDGVFMVDDQYANMTPKILAAIDSITDKPLRFLLNTHWHGDHTGGNENMEKEGAVIIAHENVRKRMSVEQFRGERVTPASPKAALPVVTFTKDLTFHMNGEDIFVFHVHHAHTDGDAMVYFSGSNVLHMGDTYFQGKYPYIDLDSGGSVNGYLAAHKKALMLINEETKIIPGHRNLSNKEELQHYTEALTQLVRKVEEAIANGDSEETIAKNETLTAELDAQKFGDWFIKPERMRRTIYRSLTAKNQNTN